MMFLTEGEVLMG